MIASLRSIVLCACVIISSSEARSFADSYQSERENLLNEELSSYVGGNLQLTNDEQVANDILMQLKTREKRQMIEDPRSFNYTDSYLKFRKNIERSHVYQVIKRMPKGAVLHVHTSMMLDADSLIDLTYEDNLYACFSGEGLQLIFRHQKPSEPCSTRWNLLADLRKMAEDVNAFDKRLQKIFTIDKNYINFDEQKIWNYFEKKFAIVNALTKYEPLREKFFYRALQRFYDDNIRYIELRGSLTKVYDLSGRVYNETYIARLHESIVRKFKIDHPDFIGAKWIVTIQRKSEKKDVKRLIEQVIELQAEMPHFIIGFDLVGHEDEGNPLQYYLPQLKEYRDLVRYYFHSGETNWNGMDIDENLIDAILLGTKRIAHGAALVKHPTLMNLVKEKDIAIEVNPISNCVLGLVKDLRTHPLATYLAMGLPVVISSDDPASWNADPVSHDYFVTFMLIASNHADLKMLKQLVLNSIKYNELNDKERGRMLDLFTESWAEFIQYLVKVNPEKDVTSKDLWRSGDEREVS